MHFYLRLSLTISFLTGNSAPNIKRRLVLTTLRFHPLQASAYDGIYPVVAVPSRLYFHVSPEKPLNGKRITVKDNFHMDGMVTTLGNKAFAKYYGTQSMTSEYLKRVIDLGAIVVGKTKGLFLFYMEPPYHFTWRLHCKKETRPLFPFNYIPSSGTPGTR